MKLDRDLKLQLSSGKPGISLLGSCVIGHSRRCPRTEIEPGVCISQGVHLETGFLGCGSFVGEDTRVFFTGEIGRFATIGENCLIGARVPESPDTISTSYPVREKDLSWCRDWIPVNEPWKKKKSGKRIMIGNDVFIGDRCVIPQGIRVGDGALLCPGTVPREDVPPYGILSGNPGQLTGFRFSRQEIRQLLELKWWEYGTGLINEIPEKEREDMTHVLEKMAELHQKKKVPSRPRGEIFFSFLHKEYTAFIYRQEKERQTLLRQFPA